MITLEVLEYDDETNSQVVRWLAKFPYPIHPRLYIFVRRIIYEEEKKQIIVVCKALEPSHYPNEENHVRVTKYRSKLIVTAHKNIFEVIFEY